MNLLALDTSSDACSIALQLGDEVRDDHVVKAKQHTRILIPMIRSLMLDAGADFEDLDAIVLGNGPGSFIGMRIAASVAQGLAFASGIRILPVSSMGAVAAEVMAVHSVKDVIVAQDARMNEIYLGIYRCDDDGLPTAVIEETLQPIGSLALLDERGACTYAAAGLAWSKYPALFDLNQKAISELLDVPYPKARYLLGLGLRMWVTGGAIEPDKLIPAYLRERVASVPRGTNT